MLDKIIDDKVNEQFQALRSEYGKFISRITRELGLSEGKAKEVAECLICGQANDLVKGQMRKKIVDTILASAPPAPASASPEVKEKKGKDKDTK